MTLASWPLRSIDVLGRKIAVRDAGAGPAVVFVHGNFTSSYTWRHVAKGLAASGRLIAPDLVGMGRSDRLADSGAETYVFAVHRRYFDVTLATLGITENVVFIAHGWGAALACDWARRHPGRTRGLCHMEGEVTPLTSALMDEAMLDHYRFLRSRQGEMMALMTPYLQEKYVFEQLGGQLDTADRDEFTATHGTAGESRRPLLDWEREIPINGIPADTCEVLEEVRQWLTSSDVPKLFIRANPGRLMVGERLEAARAARNQIEVAVSAGAWPQEETPGAVSAAISAWLTPLAR